MPWIIAAAAGLIALVAVALLLIQPGESGVAERGSATPEQAATLFAESFVAGDFEAAASAFATESMVANFDFVSHVDWMGAFAPTPGYLPTDDFEGINLERRRGEVGAALGFLVRAALVPEVDPIQTYVFGDGTDGNLSEVEFEERLDASGLGALSVNRVDVIETTPGTRFAENTDTRKAAFGAQDLRTVAVLFDTPDGPAALGMEVIQFDDSWYVSMLFGAILDTTPNSLTPMSSESYADMIESAQQAVNAT